MIAEYIYFGLRPVAVKNGSNINIVHTDYLTTPRIVTSGGSIVWQWRNDNPYGNNLAQGTIDFNLRFAGQYYDAESGLHYNYYRTYNPATGRYMQSDPMGLEAGSNTYNYVERNPFDAVDPLELDTIPMGLMTKSQGAFTNAQFAIETAKKITNDNNKDILKLLSHGSITTLHGLSDIQLSKQIISGKFETDNIWKI